MAACRSRARSCAYATSSLPTRSCSIGSTLRRMSVASTTSVCRTCRRHVTRSRAARCATSTTARSSSRRSAPSHWAASSGVPFTTARRTTRAAWNIGIELTPSARGQGLRRGGAAPSGRLAVRGDQRESGRGPDRRGERRRAAITGKGGFIREGVTRGSQFRAGDFPRPGDVLEDPLRLRRDQSIVK